MLVVLLLRARVHDNVIEVNEGRLPLHLGENYVGRSLERSGSVPQTEGHALEAVQALMGREGCLVPVVLFDLNLPIAAVGIEGGVDPCVPKRVDALVHAWNWERSGIAPSWDSESGT